MLVSSIIDWIEVGHEWYFCNNYPSSSIFSRHGWLSPPNHTCFMPDVVHPPHSCSSFCLSTCDFHLHHLLHHISFIGLQNPFNVLFPLPNSYTPLSLSISVTPLICLNIIISVVSIKKGNLGIAQYPVRWTAQSASHCLPSLADLFIPTPFSVSPGIILATLQLSARTKSITFPPLFYQRVSKPLLLLIAFLLLHTTARDDDDFCAYLLSVSCHILLCCLLSAYSMLFTLATSSSVTHKSRSCI